LMTKLNPKTNFFQRSTLKECAVPVLK
jgi:hypothetical protein